MDDNRYKYVVLGLCFLLNVQSISGLSCLGIFLVEFMEYFRTTRTALTWIPAAHMGISVISGVVTGLLLKRFGPRVVGIGSVLITSSGYLIAAYVNNLYTMYVTFGLMAGIGQSTYYAIANSIVQPYFSRHRALACATALSGISVGGFLWPPFCRFLIDRLCWQGAMIILAGFHVQVIVICALLRPAPTQQCLPNTRERGLNENKTTTNEAVNDVLNQSRRTNWVDHWVFRTVVYVAGASCGMYLFAGVIIYTPVRSWQLGISKNKAALLVSIISISTGVLRLPVGLVGDVPRVDRGLLLSAALALSGVIIITSNLTGSFVPLVLCSTFYGCIIVVFTGLQTVVLSDIAGVKHVSVAMGIFMTGNGLACVMLNITAGAILDFTGSARTIFTTLGAAGLCGGSLVGLAFMLKRRATSKAKQLQQFSLELHTPIGLPAE